MERQALIKLKGKAESSETDIIDFTTQGKVYFDKNNVTIEYDESEMSGMEGSISKVIVAGDSVTLNRMGAYTSTMAFIKGQELPAEITTPQGSIKLKVYTDILKINISKESVVLNLRYAFTMGGERIRNTLIINCQII